MTSDACAKSISLFGSGIEMSATRYLRAPKTEIVYARVKLDEIKTSVDPSEGLSNAKLNMSAGERSGSSQVGDEGGGVTYR